MGRRSERSWLPGLFPRLLPEGVQDRTLSGATLTGPRDTPSDAALSEASGLPRVGQTAFVIPALLGLLLATAAMAKSIWPSVDSLQTAATYGKAGLALPIQCELIIGLWLIAGYWRTWSLWAGLITFFCFAALSLWKILTSRALEPCGCYGSLFTITAAQSLLLNIAAVASLAFLLMRQQVQAPCAGRWRLAVMVTLLLCGVATSLAAIHTTHNAAYLTDDGQPVVDGQPVLVNLENWPGQRFPLLPHIEGARSITEGKWQVLLVRQNCPHCEHLLSSLNEQSGARQGRLALVEVPGGVTAHALYLAGDVLCLRLRPGPAWHIPTPTILRLKDGIVTSVVDYREGNAL